MKSVLVLALALIVSVPAFAKITTYTADSVAVNVLQSNELARLKAAGQALEGLELTKLQVTAKVIGNDVWYTTIMQFAVPATGGAAIPLICTISAKSLVQKVEVEGITSSTISRPIFSEPRCAQ